MIAHRGCLRLKSPLPSPGLDSPKRTKSVTFRGEGEEQVFFADEWDRTPSEPSHSLSYQEILELKAIQRSLPIANQPPDPYSGRPGKNYLQKVPIALLPLLPDNDETQPTPTHTPSSEPPSPYSPERTWASDVPRHHVEPKPPSPRSSYFTPIPPQRQSVPSHLTHLSPTSPSPPSSSCPPHLAHLRPTRTAPPRPKPTFSFIPLIDAGSQKQPEQEEEDYDSGSSDYMHDPPTPTLTNASLDSSPLSRASSASPEPPPFFLMPPGRGAKHQQMETFPLSTPTKYRSPERFSDTQPLQRKRRNVMIINGIEIDLDDDDEEEEQGPSATPSPQYPRSPISSPSSSPQSLSPLKTLPSSHRNLFTYSNAGPNGRRASPCSSPVLVPSA